MIRGLVLVAAAAAVVVPLTSAQLSGATGAGGDVRISGARLGPATGGSRPLYLTIRDDGPRPDLLEAAIAPQARSATWTTARRLHTPAEVAAYAELCGSDPRLLRQSGAALAASSDVIVPAHGAEVLQPGTGQIQLNGLAVTTGTTPITLYFASGAEVTLRVTL